MRRQFIKQVGLSTLGVLFLPKIVFSNDKIIKGMRKKPMLAYPVSDKPIDYSKPVFIQPKLDGVRCLIQAEGLTPYHDSDPTSHGFIVKAYSRTGKEWKNIDHILDELHPFFAKNRNVILDGELYNHDLKDDFEKIISLVRKTKPTDEDRQEASELTQFHCYDIVDETMEFDQRLNFIRNNVPETYCIKPVETDMVFREDDAKVYHARNLDKGYEGSIVRTNDTYQCKRSHNLRKFKDFSDAEATIIGYEEGKGKREGHLGKFIMEDDNGIQFGCPPGKGYTYDMMKDMLENIHDYIGERATFTYFERTKAGSYRHPLYKGLRNYE
jgi:DNA ligase-1